MIISHDHFDHLDKNTIQFLAGKTRFVTPLGVGQHLEYWGVGADRITELDWWQTVTLDGITLHCTPSRHFSGRSLPGRDKTLWASWALVSSERRAYFSGDTGMFEGFAEIGRRLGPFDVTMIEVGAYDSAWADVHPGPEQAVEAHQMLRGKLMLPVHWGTFNLAVPAWTEPAERLMAAAGAAGIDIAIPKPGGQIDAAAPVALTRGIPATRTVRGASSRPPGGALCRRPRLIEPDGLRGPSSVPTLRGKPTHLGGSMQYVRMFLALALLAPMSANAVDLGFGKKGSLLLEGELKFSYESGESDADGTTADLDTEMELTLLPGVHYFVIDNLGLGLVVGYNRKTVTDSDDNENITSGLVFGFSPSYWIPLRPSRSLNLYIHALAGYISRGSESKPDGGDSSETTESGFIGGAGVGVAFVFGGAWGGIIRVGLDYSIMLTSVEVNGEDAKLSFTRHNIAFGTAMGLYF